MIMSGEGRTDDSHRDLVSHAATGNAVAVEELLTEQLPTLLAYLRLHAGPLLRGRESVADLAQSVCREVLQNLDGFEYRGQAPFRKWLYQKALSKIIERQRYYLAEKRHAGLERPLQDGSADAHDVAAASFFSPSQAAIRAEDLDRLEAAFALLSEEHRQVITLSRMFGYSHAQIADEMQRTEGAARVLLHRALSKLAWHMHAAGGDGGAGGATGDVDV